MHPDSLVGSNPAVARVEALVWVLAYGGLLLFVLGLATLRFDAAAGWPMLVIGALLALTGFALILVRARMRTDPSGGAKSTSTSTETE